MLASDVRDLAPDVLRHRLVLSYDALSDGVDVDDILDRVLGHPRARLRGRASRGVQGGIGRSSRRPPGSQGPGPMPGAVLGPLELEMARRTSSPLSGATGRRPGGQGTQTAQLRPYEPGDDVRRLDPAATARTGVAHVRLQAPERQLTTWMVLDMSASMAFGTADRLKSDVAEGAALTVGRIATRRGGRLGIVTCGGDHERRLPPRGGRTGYGASACFSRKESARMAAAMTTRSPWPWRRLLASRTGLVCVISDFRGPRTWRRALSSLAQRHSILAIEVVTPARARCPTSATCRWVQF